MSPPASRHCLAGLLQTLLYAGLLFFPACREQQEQIPLPERRPTPSRSPAPPTFDLWYEIRADGQRLGHRHLRLSAAPDPASGPLHLESDQLLHLPVRHPKSPRRLHISERCTLDGRLLRETAEWGTGSHLEQRHYWVKGRSLRQLDPATGKSRTIHLKKEKSLHGLCAVYLAMWRNTPALELQTLDPRTGQIRAGTLVRAPTPGARTYHYSEGEHAGTRTTFTLGATRAPERITVRSPTRIIRLTLSTRSASQHGHASPSPHRDAAGLISIPLAARFPDPLDARRIRLQLIFPDEPSPSTRLTINEAFQRLVSRKGTRLVVEIVDPEQNRGAFGTLPYKPPGSQKIAPLPKALRAQFPGTDDPRVTVAGLVKGATTRLEAALRLTRWVGTQPERAATDRPYLLVTALRLAGLRARLVSGLLCVGSLLTEHHWAEVQLGRFVPLDPETRGLGSAAHLRLAQGPDNSTTRARAYAAWRALRPGLRRLKARLLDVVSQSGFRYEPGAKKNVEITRNVLTHRAWNILVRRPLAARFVIGQPADPFEVAVVSRSGALRADLALFATQQGGLDPRAFRAMGYVPATISGRPYLVKATPKKRTYVQFACSTRPWGALLVRWTLHVQPGVPQTALKAFEAKVPGGLTLIGRSSTIHHCHQAHSHRP